MQELLRGSWVKVNCTFSMLISLFTKAEIFLLPLSPFDILINMVILGASYDSP